MMPRLRKIIRKRKWLLLVSIIALLLISDLLITWYTINYTTEDKSAGIQTTSFRVLDIKQSYSHTLLIRCDDGVRVSSPTGFQRYDLSANTVGACIGDLTDAVAISTEDDFVHFFQPGQTTPDFSINVNASITLIGITETYATKGYVPDQLVFLSTNHTGTHLFVLSIPSDGAVEWTRDIETRTVATARSASTHEFAIALDNNSVYFFRRALSTPTRIYELDKQVREMVLSDTGLHLAVLSGIDPTRLSVYRSDSTRSVIEKDLPGNCTDLRLQKQIESIFVRSGNDILEVSDEAITVKVSKQDLTSYAVPTAVGGIFVSTKESVSEYKGERDSPIWEARVGDVCANIITDYGATVVVGYDSSHILIIDNTAIILGSKTGWFFVGLKVILESIALVIALNWNRIRDAKRITLYVLVAGAFAGIAVSAVLMSEEYAEVFGGTSSYLVFVGILGAITTLVAWSSEAGLASFALGVGVGLVASVPIALVFQFVLWYSGHDFPIADPVFKSAIFGLAEGIKIGIVGSTLGYLIRRFVD